MCTCLLCVFFGEGGGFGLLNEISMLSRAFRANSGSSAVGVGNPHFGFFLCLLYVPSWFVLFLFI